MSKPVDYPKIINRVSHLLALIKEGKRPDIVSRLVLTVLGIDDLTVKSSQELRDFMRDSFGVAPMLDEIDGALHQHVLEGDVVQDPSSGAYLLSATTKVEVEKRVGESSRLENEVRKQWIVGLPESDRPGNQEQEDQLWGCLMGYTARAFLRHGAQTILLVDPTVDVPPSVSTSLTALLDEACQEACLTLDPATAAKAVELFFRIPTPERTAWLAELLDGTFAFFALSMDADTSQYLSNVLDPKLIFVDTNLIFGVLGLDARAAVDVSTEILGLAKKNGLPFEFVYHPVTFEELQRTIDAMAEKIRGREWRQDISRAAIKVGGLSGLEDAYHRANSRIQTEPDVFLSRFDDLHTLLSGYGLEKHAGSGGPANSQRQRIVNDYGRFLELKRPRGGKPRRALEHDIELCLDVRELREDSSSILTADCFILSLDYWFYAYEWQQLRKGGQVGCVVLPNQLLQLLRHLVPTDSEFDKRFVETFAIPELRSIGTDHRRTASKVLSYLNAYEDLPEETAARLLANQVLLTDLEPMDPDSTEFGQRIESALVDENAALIKELSTLEQTNEASSTEVQETRKELHRVTRALELAEKSKKSTQRRLEAEKRRAEAQRRAYAANKPRTKQQEPEILQPEPQPPPLNNNAKTRFAWWVVGILAATVLSLVSAIVDWKWLDEHPNRLGLHSAASATLVLLFGSISAKKHRAAILITGCLGFVLLIFSLVDP